MLASASGSVRSMTDYSFDTMTKPIKKVLKTKKKKKTTTTKSESR